MVFIRLSTNEFELILHLLLEPLIVKEEPDKVELRGGFTIEGILAIMATCNF